jgi:hypothetical protein
MHCSKLFYRLDQLDGVLVFNEIPHRAAAARIEYGVEVSCLTRGTKTAESETNFFSHPVPADPGSTRRKPGASLGGIASRRERTNRARNEKAFVFAQDYLVQFTGPSLGRPERSGRRWR